MTRTRATARFLVPVMIAAVATTACARKVTVVHISNDSAFELTGVVVSGAGFRVMAPDIPAGGVAEVAIVSRGESGLAVSFDAQRRTLSAPEQGYFEGGGSYEGKVVIGPDLSVSVRFRLAV